jgi:hypothetical protein
VRPPFGAAVVVSEAIHDRHAAVSRAREHEHVARSC